MREPRERVRQGTFGCAVALLAGALLVPTHVSAREARHIRFHRISLEEGLPQASVNAMIQDRLGFMWFGTQEGLNRFNGYEFDVFTHNPDDPHSISHDTVRSILEDRNGVLWVGTADGLNRFDPADGSFTRYLSDPDDPRSLSNERVRAILEDRSGT